MILLQGKNRLKADMFRSILDPGKNKRPSVETSLHEIIKYKFVVHLHPTLINGLLCSRNAKSLTHKLFGDTVLFVPYTDPGYTLFKKLESEITSIPCRSSRMILRLFFLKIMVSLLAQIQQMR